VEGVTGWSGGTTSSPVTIEVRHINEKSKCNERVD